MLELRIKGERVLLARRDLGWDQKELGRRAGLSYSFISDLERNKHNNATVDVVGRLAESLGVSVTYLLGLTDAPSGTADDGAPIEATGSRVTFEVRDPELRALLVELADLLHGMTPAQRRYFVEQAQRFTRLMEEEESRAKNPIIIG